MDRREFVAGIGATGAIGPLAGCIGSSSGGNSSESTSDNSSGGGESTTSGQTNVFDGKLRFEGKKMYVPVKPEADITKVQINSPRGQKWGSYKMQQAETSAEFKLIKDSGGSSGKYPYGEWEVYAIRDGEQVDDGVVTIRPEFSITGVQNGEYGTLSLQLENVGNGPATVTRARVVKMGADIAKNTGWALGSVSYRPKPTVPGDTATVPAQAEGFKEAYAMSNSETPSRTSASGEACAGEAQKASVDYKLFGEMHEGSDITLKLNGGRESIQTDGINCATVNLASGGRKSSNSSTSATDSA